MAYTELILENPKTGKIRVAPIGFSWTVLFFGCFPALFRKDWKWFIIMLILALLSYGLSGLVFMFIYNKFYLKDLLADGYKVKSATHLEIEQVGDKLGMDLPRFEPTAG